MRFFSFLILVLSAILYSAPVEKPGTYATPVDKNDFIDTSLNIIQFPKGDASFERLYQKLDTLVFENRGQVRILHIGGSHLQADVISGRIREHFVKEYPGASAGRGFVFPYSAAKTNTPSSYASKYKGIWTSSKNISKQVSLPLGVLGIAVSTNDPRAEIALYLNKYNPTPIWNESRIRLFGYSDSSDVVPVLRVDSMDVEGVLDTVSQSYLFIPPHPVDTINVVFRWTDTTYQATIAQMVTDSLIQDSIQRVQDSIAHVQDSLDALDPSKPKSSSSQAVSSSSAEIPAEVALPDASGLPLDSMFFGECDVLDTACVNQEEKRNSLNFQSGDSLKTDSLGTDSVPERPRPRFTLTGILTETDAPGISYSNVGINGARVPSYFEEICPNFEKELSFFKPDLVIFAIGINDANTDNFDGKVFAKNYDQLIARIKKVNPDVAMIFETNNDMYRKVRKRYVQHPAGETARQAFFKIAEKHKAGVWDKFSLMGGLGSMAQWEKANLAKKDKVHFNLAGYNLLGDLFFKAFLHAYQEHIARLPALEPVTATENTPAEPVSEENPEQPKDSTTTAPKF
ncbi:MAG: GDSL-type esterase/lipase family protein [Fibrobacter sp.]|nr:GDSL-type esterase/lipase family protein [Fibrobacter sp.]